MSSPHLSRIGGGAFLIAQCFQGCLYLGAVWRDDACSFTADLVIIGQHLAQQRPGRPPATAALSPRAHRRKITKAVHVNQDDFRVIIDMGTDRVPRLQHAAIGSRVSRSYSASVGGVM